MWVAQKSGSAGTGSENGMGIGIVVAAKKVAKIPEVEELLLSVF